MINLTRTGTANLILISIYSALYYDDTEFFASDFGQYMVSMLEEYTGVTLEICRKAVLISKVGPIKKLSQEELKTLSIPEIATKYNCTDSKVRYFISKNNLTYKRVYKKGAL